MNAAASPVTNRASSSIQPSEARPPSPLKSTKIVSQVRNIRRLDQYVGRPPAEQDEPAEPERLRRDHPAQHRRRVAPRSALMAGRTTFSRATSTPSMEDRPA